ncbi:MAG: VWA domain-containing protein [Alphaproteobacteria bacterium]|nr:VWA domain-containing protein [Alphaproteobacteria bacterium]MCB9797162.1 VWA domain-containing protein [Alphaproteobacteria bacterium]
MLFLLSLACIDYEYAETKLTDVYVQSTEDVITDVLFVIDDSASMREEQERLADNFEAFTGVLLEATADFRLGVITTDPARDGALVDGWLDTETPELDEAFRALVQVGTDGAREEQGLAMAIRALEPSVNAGFSRDEAALHLVFFSDEDDHSSGDPQYYDSELRRLSGAGGYFAHAIVGDPPGGCVSGTLAADPGERYIATALLSAGLRDSICAEDYDEVLERVGLGVSGLVDVFPLSSLAEAETVRVWVDEVDMPQREVDGWTYDLGDNAVAFHGRAVPRPGRTITIEYEPLVGRFTGDGSPDVDTGG